MEDEKLLIIMKRLITKLLLSGCIFFPLLSQAQFNTWTPIENYQDTPTKQTYGYISTSDGWVRVNIQVKYGKYSATIVAYKEKNTGRFNTWGGDSWRNCNARAQEVSEYSDGKYAANNFDYKAYIYGLGTVYF